MNTWASTITDHNVQAAVFYTPMLPLFCQTESFKSTQLGLKCIHVAGSALTDEIRSQVEKKFLAHQKIQDRSEIFSFSLRQKKIDKTNPYCADRTSKVTISSVKKPAIGQFFGSTELNMTGLGTVWSSYGGRNCVGSIWNSRDYKVR